MPSTHNQANGDDKHDLLGGPHHALAGQQLVPRCQGGHGRHARGFEPLQHFARAIGQAHPLALLEAELLERLIFQHLPLPSTAELNR